MPNPSTGGAIRSRITVPTAGPSLAATRSTSGATGDPRRLLTGLFALVLLAQGVLAGGPSVDLGPDRAVIVPQMGLSIGAAVEADEPIVSHAWTQLSGPSVTLVGASSPTLVLDDLVPGTMTFRLTVQDQLGQDASDVVGVEVAAAGEAGGSVSGDLFRWQRVEVDFLGPETHEGDSPNPFLHRRLDVLFVHASTGHHWKVPGFFAADGNASQTGASAGTVWRARFTPPYAGTWLYKASFRAGNQVAIDDDPLAGNAYAFDGATGQFAVGPVPASAQGFQAKGRLSYVGDRYLRFEGTNRAFLKGGADSPENLLAFADFDATPASHYYQQHVSDWNAGDPTWQGNKGRGLVGALNYLAGKGMNSVYFLTFNVGGDGDDVWPWTTSNARTRFDVSKLAQWEIVFDHMDRLGLMLHVVTQEQENDNGGAGLDGGALGQERRLYYRELVARFSHHLGVTWNLGEENTNTTSQQVQFYDHIKALDPYDHFVVVHTFPDKKDDVYDALLDEGVLDGASLQNHTVEDTHAATLEWREASLEHGMNWVVSLDEFGPSSHGVLPDNSDYWHDETRKRGLWANLMAGGAGAEWYFGYAYPNDDLDCENWRSREHVWELTDIALQFFDRLPFDKMEPNDQLVTGEEAWCLSDDGDLFAVYLPEGGTGASIDLGTSQAGYRVLWYDPRNGGHPSTGSVPAVYGPGWQNLGAPPSESGQDWAIMVQRHNAAPVISATSASPNPFPGNTSLTFSLQASDADGVDDIVSAIFHVYTPDDDYQGSLAAHPTGPGEWSVTLPFVGELTPGDWQIIALVGDGLGARGYAPLVLTVPDPAGP